MPRVLARIPFLLAAFAASGCPTPMTTRLPQIDPGNPRVEKRSYERFDPFPDPDLGPDTLSRPPGFQTERTQPRRNYEDRIFQGRPRDTGPQGPQFPPTGYRYPEAIQ